jgi:hypothetical protein
MVICESGGQKADRKSDESDESEQDWRYMWLRGHGILAEPRRLSPCVLLTAPYSG